MRTLPSDFNGFRLANSKFGFVITLKGLDPHRMDLQRQGRRADGIGTQDMHS